MTKDRQRRLFEPWPDPALAEEVAYNDLWFCIDCVFYIENGELPENEARAHEVREGVAAWEGGREGDYIFAGRFVNDRYGPPYYCQRCGREVVETEEEGVYRHYDEGYDEHHQALCNPDESDGSGYNEFSSSSCDCCHTHLAGMRERYTVFARRMR